MQISLPEASRIIGSTADELMFLYQSNKIQASVDQETLAWRFDLKDVLSLKESLDQEAREKEALREKEKDSDDR